MRVDLDDIQLTAQAVDAWVNMCANLAHAIFGAIRDDEPPHIGEEYGVIEDGQLTIACEITMRGKTARITMTVPDDHWQWREQKLN